MSSSSSRRRGCLSDQDAFSRWRREIDHVLEAFIARYAPQITGRLDFSPASLSLLENWLLCHTAGAIRTEPDDFLRQRLAIYVGEVFRRNLGGEWTVAFHAVDPHLRGLPLVNCPPACCPILLIDELLRKRNGFTLLASFEYFRKRRLRRSPPPPTPIPPPPAPARTIAAAEPSLQVFGFRQLPREVLRDRLAATFQLTFAEEDSLPFGPFATAHGPVTAHGELWRLFRNFNPLENAWLEDAHRDCDLILYIAHPADPTRAAELLHRILCDFPTATRLRTESPA